MSINLSNALRNIPLRAQHSIRFLLVALFLGVVTLVPTTRVQASPPAPTEDIAPAAVSGRVIMNVHSRKCFDIAGGNTGNNANVQQYTCHAGDNQRWTLAATSQPNTVLLKSSQNLSKCLDVAGGSTQDGANIQMYECHGGPAQQFRFQETGTYSEFYLVNVHSGKCIDIAGGSVNNHANVQQFTCHGGGSQRFKWLWTN